MRVPPELHEQICARHLGGETLDQVAQWLATKGVSKTDGKPISKQALSKIVKKFRAERGEVSRHKVRDHIEKTLPAALDERAKILAAQEKIYWKLNGLFEDEPSVAYAEATAKVFSGLQRAWDSQDKALGVHEPEQSLANDLAQILGRQL